MAHSHVCLVYASCIAAAELINWKSKKVCWICLWLVGWRTSVCACFQLNSHLTPSFVSITSLNRTGCFQKATAGFSGQYCSPVHSADPADQSEIIHFSRSVSPLKQLAASSHLSRAQAWHRLAQTQTRPLSHLQHTRPHAVPTAHRKTP